MVRVYIYKQITHEWGSRGCGIVYINNNLLSSLTKENIFIIFKLIPFFIFNFKIFDDPIFIIISNDDNR